MVVNIKRDKRITAWSAGDTERVQSFSTEEEINDKDDRTLQVPVTCHEISVKDLLGCFMEKHTEYSIESFAREGKSMHVAHNRIFNHVGKCAVICIVGKADQLKTFLARFVSGAATTCIAGFAAGRFATCTAGAVAVGGSSIYNTAYKSGGIAGAVTTHIAGGAAGAVTTHTAGGAAGAVMICFPEDVCAGAALDITYSALHAYTDMTDILVYRHIILLADLPRNQSERIGYSYGHISRVSVTDLTCNTFSAIADTATKHQGSNKNVKSGCLKDHSEYVDKGSDSKESILLSDKNKRLYPTLGFLALFVRLRHLLETVYHYVMAIYQKDILTTYGGEKYGRKLKESLLYLTMTLDLLTLILVSLFILKKVTFMKTRTTTMCLKIKDSTVTRATHEGAGAFNGKPKLDPTDPDGFESVEKVGADVFHVFRLQEEVEENGFKDQHVFASFATKKGQAPVVPVATSASVPGLSVDPNQQMIHSNGNGVHVSSNQHSLSVLSDVTITLFSYIKEQIRNDQRNLINLLVDLDNWWILKAVERIHENGQHRSDFSIPMFVLTTVPTLHRKTLKRFVGEAGATVLSMKRKELPQDWDFDRIVKRRRNVYVCVTTKLLDDIYYDEDSKAFSLRNKKPVSVAVVNFLTSLKAWNRKEHFHVILERFKEEVMKSKEISEKDLEVLKFGIANPVHRGPSCYLVKDKGVVIKSPGLENSDKLSFGKSVPLIQGSLEEGYIYSKVSNVVKISQQDVAHHQEEKELTSLKARLLTGQEAAFEDVTEEVDNETAGFETAIKDLKIRIQVRLSKFEKQMQSDVTSITKDNFQKALNSVRSDTFMNLAKKNIQGSSCMQDKVSVKFNQPKLNEETSSENVALLRELTCIKNVELPDPQIDFDCLLRAVQVFHIQEFEPVMAIIDQIANGTPPTPHVSMRYELLRFCTLRSYPKENKPYLIRLAMAGFYYASDGDGVVCYCCGTRRYNWVAKDDPMKVHQRINPNCKFLKKNEEVNVRVKYFGPYGEKLMYIMNIPEPVERPQVSEDVNNDWAPERIRSPAPAQQNSQIESGASSLGINTAIPKHAMYAPKTTREASYNGWPDSSSHTPQELSDAGFFYAGFGDCVRCFYCGIGLRHWARDDNPWIEHARWSRNCVYLRQKKGEEFVNLVQFALQYSQKEADAEQSSASGNQVPVLDVEKILLSDAAQSVLEMGYPPIKIKRAIEEILRRDGNVKITASVLMQKVLDMEEVEKQTQSASVPAPTPAATAKPQTVETSAKSGKPASKEIKSNTAKGKTEGSAVSNTNTIEKENSKNPVNSNEEAKSIDPKAIKAENELLKEQTLCKVCLDNTVCIVFLPCGHLVTCADCAPAMRKCPICRALVKGTVRTYMP